MLTVFSNDIGEFTSELCDNAVVTERREIRVTGERRVTTNLEVLALTFICTYVCSGLVHRLELPCGNIHPRDLNANKRTEERYEEFRKKFSDICAGQQLKMLDGLLEVRLGS